MLKGSDYDDDSILEEIIAEGFEVTKREFADSSEDVWVTIDGIRANNRALGIRKGALKITGSVSASFKLSYLTTQ